MMMMMMMMMVIVVMMVWMVMMTRMMMMMMMMSASLGLAPLPAQSGPHRPLPALRQLIILITPAAVSPRLQ